MNKKKRDYLIFTLGFQFLICAVAFGILFGLKATNSAFYGTIKSDYFDNLHENFSFDTNVIDESTSEVVSETQTVATQTNVTTETQAAEVNATVTEITENTLSAEINAEGGADYSLGSDNEIPSNVSVNSYSLNQKMYLPVKGKTTSSFGVRNHPISGDLRFHAGIDIAAQAGTPIYAAFDGTVTVAGYDEWNGYHIKISHDSDIMTVYCHCEELYVENGETVEAGEIIAAIGSTGSSTGPHLHFELRINNVSYDPQTALNEAVSAV